MKVQTLLILMGLWLVSIFLTKTFWKENRIISHTDTLSVKVDTAAILRNYKMSLKPVLKFIKVKESINIDSLWNEAKNYWLARLDSAKITTPVQYVATSDTTTKDSLLTAKTKYISPIPLHPNGYFQNEFIIREREITKEITLEKYLEAETSFTDRFHYSANVGFGYGLINKQLDFYIGGGVSFEF